MNSLEEMKQQIINSHDLREKFLADRHRPGYHFAIPEDIGVPGDPNCAFFACGRYHLMYLYASRSDGFRYGHISSIDLMHWRSHPDAVMPDSLDGGIFSGGAFVDDDGTCYMTYWALAKPGFQDGIRIAKSSPPYYEKWEKFSELSLTATEGGLTEIKDKDGNPDYIGCSDPSNIWKKNGKYYMQAGNLPILLKFRGKDIPIPENIKGDWVDLYESDDLVKWRYLHRFYDRDSSNADTAEDEDDMCPSFLPLPKCLNGGESSGKYLQLFISHNKGCQYYIGDYDKANDKFIRNSHGRMTWTDNTFFAPEALIDSKGRQIMWAWLLDNMEGDAEYGWSGVYGLPRLLWLNKENNLGITVADEVRLLRYNQQNFDGISLNENSRKELDIINPLSCEIDFTIDMIGDGRAGVILRSSCDESTATYVYYDKQQKNLCMDTTKGTKKGRPALEIAPLEIADGEKLRFTVFIDKSVIEVFVNDKQAICRRVFIEQDNCDMIKLYTENCKAVFSEIQTFEMMPSNFY